MIRKTDSLLFVSNATGYNSGVEMEISGDSDLANGMQEGSLWISRTRCNFDGASLWEPFCKAETIFV